MIVYYKLFVYLCCYCNDGSQGGRGESEMFNKNILLLNYVFLFNKQQNDFTPSLEPPAEIPHSSGNYDVIKI